MRNVELEFGADRVYSCASSAYSSVRLEIEPSSEVDLSWDWQMKKTGSIPPGTNVWWRWRVEDEGGRRYLSPAEELSWEDPRFQWSSFAQEDLTIYWYEGASDFGEKLAQTVGLSLLSAFDEELAKPIKAFVYTKVDDARGAVLFTQEWTGALAYPSYNILLAQISSDAPDPERRLLIHELAHLAIEELSFNCLADLPTWLDEGLATYLEGSLAQFLQDSLDLAIRLDKLISVRSLNSSFPADPDDARLAYGQSFSLVRYLRLSFGWDRMRQLLAVFKEGSTSDDALEQVYGFDSDGLDERWREYVGVRQSSEPLD